MTMTCFGIWKRPALKWMLAFRIPASNCAHRETKRSTAHPAHAAHSSHSHLKSSALSRPKEQASLRLMRLAPQYVASHYNVVRCSKKSSKRFANLKDYIVSLKSSLALTTSSTSPCLVLKLTSLRAWAQLNMFIATLASKLWQTWNILKRQKRKSSRLGKSCTVSTMKWRMWRTMEPTQTNQTDPVSYNLAISAQLQAANV